MKGLLPVCLAAASLLPPAPAGAQGAAYGSVGAMISQDYESNLFATAGVDGEAQRGVITRIGPIVEAGYRSEPFRLSLRYEAAAERFWDRPALNRRLGRQEGSFDLAFSPSRPVTLGLASSYIETHSPLEIDTGTSLVLGRIYAQRLTARPSLTWESSAVTRVTLDYEFVKEALGTGAATFLHTPGVRIERRGPRATYRVDYRTRAFGPPDAAFEATHIVVGGVRVTGRAVEADIEAGPRLFQAGLHPEINAALRLRRRFADYGFSYAETETSVLGERGLMDVRRLRVDAAFQLGRDATITAAPMWLRDRRDDRYAVIQAVEASLAARLSRRATLIVSGTMGRHAGTLSGAYKVIPYQTFETLLRLSDPGEADPLDRPRGGAAGRGPDDAAGRPARPEDGRR
ncbi:MAG: hypothetical protein IT176_03395 [Acidobacteria bacterium]|nr:hypothetical protein [Acidobacteriota bacterium]